MAELLLDFRPSYSAAGGVRNVVHRAAARDLPPAWQRTPGAEALALIRTWLRFPIQAVTVDVMQAAMAAAARWNLRYWDAAIVESARSLGCSVLLSEDLQHGQDFDGLEVLSPFLARAAPGSA